MGHNILLVDDDPLVLSSLKRSLRKEAFNVLCASSAEEALDILEKGCVDLVISDQEMPGISGTDFLATVSRDFPDTIRFMLTGNASLEVALQAINKGAVSRFFVKPCNNIELAVAIRQALQQKDFLTQARRLLFAAKRQSTLLDELERCVPGITHVKRDRKGAIILNEESGQIEDLMNELGCEIVRVEKQLEKFHI